jgi:hypothetical protein
LNIEGKNDRWLDTARISPDGTKIAYLLGERGSLEELVAAGVMNADLVGIVRSGRKDPSRNGDAPPRADQRVCGPVSGPTHVLL